MPGFRMPIMFATLCFLAQFAGNAWAERIFFAGYKGGFYIKSEEEGGMELRLGGSFQADYRYYAEKERADNRFDVRRARLAFRGQLTQWFLFGLEYEFQGNETRHLVDAYGEAVIKGAHGLRFGQFKEPFSLEWQTRDKGIFFAERSMGYCLGPKRDIGAMLHGSFLQGAVGYAAGIFNGDGVDGTSGGERDDPELAARFVVRPFQAASVESLRSFQIGCSATYARIDLSNVNLEVKSSGMAGSDRNIYELKQNTKFGVIRGADDRIRFGVESGWTCGPFAATGEYVRLQYRGLKPSGSPARDAEFSSYHASLVYCITGEYPVLAEGVMKPLRPNSFFDPAAGSFGALAIAVRAEHFEGDDAWITPGAHVSAREADAFGLALNWILFPMHRIIFDFTHTNLSDPIRVRVEPDGRVRYIEEENVLTIRLCMDF